MLALGLGHQALEEISGVDFTVEFVAIQFWLALECIHRNAGYCPTKDPHVTSLVPELPEKLCHDVSACEQHITQHDHK